MKHLRVLLGIVLYYFILYALKTTCIIKYITGYRCLFCGITRAIISLIKFDFAAYISYHPLAVFIVIALLFFIHRNLFKNRLLVYIFNIAVFTANVIWYITTF